MEPAEDLRPTFLPDGAVELRIHGVSGTPPESLLKATPIRVAGSHTSGFCRAQAAGTEKGLVEAYCWGGLTSGSRRSALWLLLLPFALLNVAGWMLPNFRDGVRAPETWSRVLALLGRLAALGLTLLLAATLFIVAFAVLGIDLPGGDGALAQVNLAWSSIREEPTVRLASTVVLASIALGLFQLTARMGGGRTGPAVDLQNTMTAAAAPAPFAELWSGTAFDRFLGLIHLGAAWGSLAVVTAVVVGEEGPWWSWLVAFAGLLAVFLALVTLVSLSLKRSVIADWLETVTLLVGGVAVIGGALAALFADGVAALESDVVDSLSLAEAVAAGAHTIILMFLGLVIVATLVIHLRVGGRGRLYSVAFTTWGLAAAASAPSGLLIIFDLADGTSSIYLAAWLFVVFGLLIAIGFLYRWNPLKGDAVVRALALRSAVQGALGTIRWTGVGLGLASMTCLVWFVTTSDEKWFIDGRLPNPISWWGGAIGWGLVLVLVMVALRPVLLRVLVGLVVVGAVAWVVRDRLGDIFGGDVYIELDLADAAAKFVSYAGYVVMVAPILATVWFIFRASGERNNRRAVGVFSDLANYWPRWFHPWAPVPYNETAIPALKQRLDHLTSAGKKVLISGHSQGAVMAIPILHDAEGSTGLRFLSYGCLIDKHYADLFPRFFNDAVFTAVDANVGYRWRNLHRITDPLGHRVGYLGGRSTPADHLEDELPGIVLSHSDYQYSNQYQGALDVLLDVE